MATLKLKFVCRKRRTENQSVFDVFGQRQHDRSTYLVLSGLDHNEYTAGASGATGTLSGNGASDHFSAIGGDAARHRHRIYYRSSSGRYYNSSYGYFDQLTYTASTSVNDVTNHRSMVPTAESQALTPITSTP